MRFLFIRQNCGYIGSIFLVAILVLNGCAGKQDSGVEVVMPSVNTHDKNQDPLSHQEQAALRSTGAIDRDMPDHAMEDVKKQYQYLLRNGRKNVCAFSKRSEQYLAYARNVFKSRGMPEELANLAIVESGYRPNAVSSAGAAGAWQFMPQTGLKYGLTQDWWQDERLDPYKATEAAADYLQKLYNDFGDWPTAIAAYNAGEGKMSRALKGTGGKDFFEAKQLNHRLDEKAQLREETKQYVPKFLAVTKIMRNLPDLGFEPINPEKSEIMMRYTAKPGTDLKAMSKACKLPWSEFVSYNPHHKRNITCTDKQTFVYVPSRVEKLATQYLCTSEKFGFAGWQPVKVSAKNDSLEQISKRSKVPLERLVAANPGLGRLKAGQVILAPANINMNFISEKTGKKNGDMDRLPTINTHKVKASETLYAIARKYNVDMEKLKDHNGLKSNVLQAGLTLKIPGKDKSAVKRDTVAQGRSSGKIGKKKQVYVVREKDSLWNIAKRHKITVENLKQWNKVDEKSLKPGLSLVVAEE